jgi:hypothetical protein
MGGVSPLQRSPPRALRRRSCPAGVANATPTPVTGAPSLDFERSLSAPLSLQARADHGLGIRTVFACSNRLGCRTVLARACRRKECSPLRGSTQASHDPRACCAPSRDVASRRSLTPDLSRPVHCALLRSRLVSVVRQASHRCASTAVRPLRSALPTSLRSHPNA